MRPITLELSAFGPYASKTVIEMDRLGDQGIYLITGNTGAGKSTIFDAICYVLYGDASGPNKIPAMLRSKYAEPNTPTYVEMTFEHFGKIYRIKRNPEYMRPSKKGDKVTKNVANAEIEFPDGRIVTKIKEVTIEVENLLGINRDQFSQIVMLAQGDFLKLLVAETKDRQDILRKLFKTQYYELLGNKVKEKSNALTKEVKSERDRVDQYINDILIDEDDPLSVDVNKAKCENMPTNQVMDLLNKIIEKDEDILNKLDNELEDVKQELEKVNSNIGLANTVNKAKEDLEKSNKKLQENEEKTESIETTFIKARDELQVRDKYQGDIAKLKEELEQYDTYDELKKKIEETKNKLADYETKLEESNKKYISSKDSLLNFKTRLKELENAGTNLANLKNQNESLKNKDTELKSIEDKLNEWDDKQKEIKDLREKYIEKDKVFREKNAIYEHMDKAFRDGQAGILAMNLEEGIPCPVCGATTHPNLASLKDEVPTKEALDKAKDDVKKARDKATSTSQDIKVLSNALEIIEKDLKERCNKSFDKEVDINEIKPLLGTKESEIKDLKTQITNKINVEMSNVKEKDDISNKKIPELEESITTLDETINKLNGDISTNKANLENDIKQAESTKKKLRHDSKKEALDYIKKLEEEVTRIQKTYEEAENNRNTHANELVRLKEQIKSSKDIINANKEVDFKKVFEEKEQLDIKQKSLIKKKTDISSRNHTNTSVRNNINKLSQAISKKEEKLTWIKALSDTVNGDINGKDKVTFETYIQSVYFERILKRANLRLLKMSGEQYELKRMEEAEKKSGKTGLDIEVIDHYNGTKRSVKSLSGGESFMASLSLALGLSDEVQSRAGGIQIDTMFVDEGFGSLDSDTLDKAYNALVGVSNGNKLIGIISHVEGLKSKIDKMLVVTKGKEGGSKVEIIV